LGQHRPAKLPRAPADRCHNADRAQCSGEVSARTHIRDGVAWRCTGGDFTAMRRDIGAGAVTVSNETNLVIQAGQVTCVQRNEERRSMRSLEEPLALRRLCPFW
jgi:hypothetical protein